MDKELISVVITTYKRPVDIVKRAIDSVLAQSYTEIELFVINDCPENKGLSRSIASLIRSYQDNRIKYIVNKKNIGACASRNVGINNAKGSYIAFLDDDDEWFPHKLEHQIRQFPHKDIGLVYCKFIKLDSNGQIKKTVPIKDIRRNKISSMLKENAIGSTSFPLIRSECFKKCGQFNTQLQSCQDWDMWFRIIKKYNVAFCDEYLVKYYISDDGITANMKKRLQGWNQMLKINKAYYQKDKESHVYFLNYIAEQLYKNRYYGKSSLYYIKSKLVNYLQ